MRAHYLALAAITLSVLTACGSSAPPSPADAKPAAEASDPPPSKPRATACDLVTGVEMSAILGGKVVPTNHDRSNGKTECVYTAAEGVSPYAQLSVEWGSGEDAMVAASMMNKREPGIADPYEGIGDQAVAIGTTLMIRSGEDLVTLVFSGVDDVPGKARRIYDTVKARM
ncbi:MAG: hypothetical protein WDO56_18680 [Gammaproteobacteria bacterium]